MGPVVDSSLATDRGDASAGPAPPTGFGHVTPRPEAAADAPTKAAETRRSFSLGARLAAVVLVTGATTFGAIGVLTAMRLNRGLDAQGAALSELSEQRWRRSSRAKRASPVRGSR